MVEWYLGYHFNGTSILRVPEQCHDDILDPKLVSQDNSLSLGIPVQWHTDTWQSLIMVGWHFGSLHNATLTLMVSVQWHRDTWGALHKNTLTFEVQEIWHTDTWGPCIITHSLFGSQLYTDTWGPSTMGHWHLGSQNVNIQTLRSQNNDTLTIGISTMTPVS